MDTAQPAMAAETDTIAEAADAFKVALGQTPARPRDESGRFASQAPEAEEEEEINAGEEESEPAANDEDTDEGEEAADEAQPEAVDMPLSWSKEDAGTWSALPPEAQAKIVEREGQRDTAVNQKFQEAANLRKAYEADIIEAKTNRQRYAEAIDQVMNLVQPQWPSDSMLDVNSSDYDPDAYHLQRAQAERQYGNLQYLASQRQQLTAQEQAQAEQEAQQQANEINRTTAPALIADFPDAVDPQKAQTFFTGLVEYAIKAGAPPSYFQNGPVAAVEWHIIAKAQKYDEIQAAKAKVNKDPKPEPRRAAPAVRPGVTTPKGAIQQKNQKAALDRLARTGSIEDGAAVFKSMFRST